MGKSHENSVARSASSGLPSESRGVGLYSSHQTGGVTDRFVLFDAIGARRLMSGEFGKRQAAKIGDDWKTLRRVSDAMQLAASNFEYWTQRRWNAECFAIPGESSAILAVMVRSLVVGCVVLACTTATSVVRGQEAAPATSIRIQAGFQVRLLRSARAGEGSWISMTFDDRGRIIVGRDDAGVARLTLPAAEDEATSATEITYERLDSTLRHCRGVLYAHDSLYVCATDSKGFYRLRDTTGDDRFDEVKLLKAMDYRSRYGHGTNQVVLGPDQMIYVVNGNDVSFPEGVSPKSAYRDPRNDWLIPEPRDTDQDNRVGHILRTDAEGRSWEVIAGGFRNQFDLAFNADGEMFTWDADMEWDVGLPWYRPTRLNHVVSGGEYGWRWGTGKWPAYFADSLPSTLDTGLGSPTALAFGTRSNFPERYRRALFMADWQNGRVLVVHMRPVGASYTCRYDMFLEGGPLNISDMEFGPDGALYFITGGRGSQSGLYRVSPIAKANESNTDERASSASNSELDEVNADEAAKAAEARALRRQLEQLHRREEQAAVERAWPYLNSSDPWLRWAARVAIERQPLETWRARALAESRTTAKLAALLALARQGEATDQPALLEALRQLPLDALGKDDLLAALRVYSLAFIRMGEPNAAARASVVSRLDAIYPHDQSSVNQQLCTLLVYLRAPRVIDKTLRLMEAAATQEQQIHYVHMLVRLNEGWSSSSRTEVLRWLLRAKSFRGGRLLPTAINNLQTDFVAGMNDAERGELASVIVQLDQPPTPEDALPTRPFVRQWRMEDLMTDVSTANAANSSEEAKAHMMSQGKQALAAATCLKCHRLGDEGGQVGPDLSTVGKRFDKRMLLESILEPSKVVDPKYRNVAYLLNNGKIVAGRPVSVSSKQIVVETDPVSAATVTIDRAAIDESFPAEASPMPSGLVDTLTKAEILSLLDYLHSITAGRR
ncbi:MAG: c-type cytochrome [Planctomycetales bacterium]|nr:c-type cytochrome [Planctomycetales bacterium]